MSEMSRYEHDEAWSAIARSPLFSAYIYELHWLACDVVRRAEALFEQTPSPEPGSGYIKVDPSLSSEIYALLSDAAKMRLLITKRQKHVIPSSTSMSGSTRRLAISIATRSTNQ